jgi:copper chaperone CopZ
VSVAVKKLDGVESVEVSLAKAAADIRLEPGNAVTLAQLRRVIRQAGYPTRDATIEARGVIVDRNGKPALDLLNGSFLELAAKPAIPDSGTIEVTGTSQVLDKGREVLRLNDKK